MISKHLYSKVPRDEKLEMKYLLVNMRGSRVAFDSCVLSELMKGCHTNMSKASITDNLSIPSTGSVGLSGSMSSSALY